MHDQVPFDSGPLRGSPRNGISPTLLYKSELEADPSPKNPSEYDRFALQISSLPPKFGKVNM
jgi:hypothetical protein